MASQVLFIGSQADFASNRAALEKVARENGIFVTYIDPTRYRWTEEVLQMMGTGPRVYPTAIFIGTGKHGLVKPIVGAIQGGQIEALVKEGLDWNSKHK